MFILKGHLSCLYYLQYNNFIIREDVILNWHRWYMDGASIQIVHYFDHVYLEEERSMIHSFPFTFGAKYLTDMVTSVPPYSLIKKNILHQSKNYKNHFENSNFWGMWPLGHVGHVTYSFINILFISTGIFDDKHCPQILSVGTTANSSLRHTVPHLSRNQGMYITASKIFHGPCLKNLTLKYKWALIFNLVENLTFQSW